MQDAATDEPQHFLQLERRGDGARDVVEHRHLLIARAGEQHALLKDRPPVLVEVVRAQHRRQRAAGDADDGVRGRQLATHPRRESDAERQHDTGRERHLSCEAPRQHERHARHEDDQRERERVTARTDRHHVEGDEHGHTERGGDQDRADERPQPARVRRPERGRAERHFEHEAPHQRGGALRKVRELQRPRGRGENRREAGREQRTPRQDVTRLRCVCIEQMGFQPIGHTACGGGAALEPSAKQHGLSSRAAALGLGRFGVRSTGSSCAPTSCLVVTGPSCERDEARGK